MKLNEAEFVEKAEDWMYSNAEDYYANRKGLIELSYRKEGRHKSAHAMASSKTCASCGIGKSTPLNWREISIEAHSLLWLLRLIRTRQRRRLLG